MPTSPSPAPPGVARPPWRGLALLTAAVVAAHLVLLGLAPTAVGPHPSPLASKFITRSIVVAPPAAEPAASPSPPAVTARPPPPPPRPARARAVAHPRPPAPEAESPAPAQAPATGPIAQAAIDAGVETPPSAQPSAAPGPATAESAPAAAAPANGGNAAGQVEGPVPLRVPGSVRLAFAVTGQQGTSPMQGVFGDLVWLQDGQQYDARLSLTFLFRTLRTQHSNGAIGATGIEPVRFSETRKNEVASHFVRDQGTVVFSNNAPSVPLLAGAQDRLSVVMQLGALLAGDPGRYPAGAAFAIQTVGPRDAEIWIFKVEGEEKLSVPAGDFVVRKLTRNPRRPFDDTVELWVAPELGYLPVRIKQTQAGGDFADLQLRDLQRP
jgi:hypothetical protein